MKTLIILQKYFYWNSLKYDVNKYIQSCVVCSIAKPLNWRQGLYTHFLVPSQPWESISMEYLIGYPTTKHQHDTILVVVDRYSKMAKEYYDNTAYYSTLLWTCLETLWPSDDHHFWQRFQICQHILEESLAIAQHETLFVNKFVTSDSRTDISCDSLGSTSASRVQPQAL